MAERRVSGIEISEQSGADHAIDRVPTGIAAFVGRTLKGPVNRPVSVASFAEFQQMFGGLWQPSMLSYAVEQFFENGGRSALMCTRGNGARPATLSLPAAARVLRLAASTRLARIYARGRCDYDGIRSDDTRSFNLVLQRVRTGLRAHRGSGDLPKLPRNEPGARRDTWRSRSSPRAWRVSGACRPSERSIGPAGCPGDRLRHANADGDDGAPLTDYDIIGSAAAGTGIFALKSVTGFNLLCIPPLAREQDVGLGTLSIAARFCAEQHAMLVVDPPLAWNSPHAALESLRDWPMRSENAVMYFPRVARFRPASRAARDVRLVRQRPPA